ncbi:response regulator transcription factor [Paenibacillus sedimenti]|uniref:Response regulator transcription factor n=1 Tax=Paenibacillus sedimenti TaxID=2770274 RepID=A0A926KK38_9BACL|nr:response regulator transcription factor [Paenibacillus sedimenti]MBD0379219.1 response regulator transcription factor [Paenibacillus sedimenti]
MKKILIVDDDKEIAQLISIYLHNEGFELRQAHDGNEALEQMDQIPPNLIILDIMMPGMDGLEVCRKVREKSAVPILMLSAKTQDMDKVLGLMTGADDYMIKPFNPLELVARVKSLLRRSFQYNSEFKAETDPVLRIQSIEIHKQNHRVTANSKEIVLTGREFDILYLLDKLEKELGYKLIQTVWGVGYKIDA